MPPRPKVITTVDEYAGEDTVMLGATQLGPAVSSSAARKVVQEWVDFFSAGPSPIRELEFTTRTPARLFDALSGQTQLESLEVKWGDYRDLSAVAGMEGLRCLFLRGASKVDDLEPLRNLTSLEALAIEGFKVIANPDPLGRLSQLTELELGGDWVAPRNGHLASLDFLHGVPLLEDLLLHALIVDDKDYSPVLSLRRLRTVRIMAVRGMRPTIEELKASLPWSE